MLGILFQIVVLLCASCAIPLDAKPSKGGSPPPQEASLEERKLKVELDRLNFERQKFEHQKEMDQKAAKTEELKAYLSVLAPVITLIVGFATVLLTWRNFVKQQTDAADLQAKSAKHSFHIKAAEIAFDGRSPEAVQNRASVLKKMFGEDLPPNFPAPFEPGEYGGAKEDPDQKVKFAELLLRQANKKEEVLKVWEALFADSWLDRVRSKLTESVGQSPENASETKSTDSKDGGLPR